MNNLANIIPLLTALSLGACVIEQTDGDNTNKAPGSPDAGSVETQINGMPASEYYAQFQWETTGTSVSGAAAMSTNASGNDLFVADFFPMKDGSLFIYYGEGQGEVNTTGFSINYDKATLTKLEGSWRIDGAELVLGDYFRCSALTLNGVETLRCSLDATIVSQEAVGSTGYFEVDRFGESSPHDSEWQDYK
jgi:hypothetical protein